MLCHQVFLSCHWKQILNNHGGHIGCLQTPILSVCVFIWGFVNINMALTCKNMPRLLRRGRGTGRPEPWRWCQKTTDLKLKHETRLWVKRRNVQIDKSKEELWCDFVVYPCPRWFWHSWRPNWHHWPWTRWCSRRQSHWRSGVEPADSLLTAPPCCTRCEWASGTERPESRCTPLWEDWKTNSRESEIKHNSFNFKIFDKSWRIHLPWQVTVISRTFLSSWGATIRALLIWTISTFSMPSGDKNEM